MMRLSWAGFWRHSTHSVAFVQKGTLGSQGACLGVTASQPISHCSHCFSVHAFLFRHCLRRALLLHTAIASHSSFNMLLLLCCCPVQVLRS